MGKAINRIVLIACFTLPALHMFAQSGVGIGTSNPNPNAALDIKSAANDKGILIPRLTSAQRLAMNISLSVLENGLLVYDSNLNAFYYWNGSAWNSTTVIQDLQLVGNTLSITNNGSATNIDLAPFSGTNTDEQTLSLAGTNLAITGGNTVDLASLQDGVNDADSNPTNELQTISKSGTTVSLSNGGGSFVDDDTDADADPANEIQTMSITGTALTISSGNTVTLPPAGIAKEAFKAYLGKTVIINALATAVLFDIKLYDINGNYDNGAGTYTAPVNGIYHFNGLISVNTGSLPTRVIISAGGVNVYDKQIYPGNSNESVGFASDILLSKGDAVGIILFVTDAKSFDIIGGREFTHVAGRLVTEL